MLFLLVCNSAWGQQRVPVFGTSVDSSAYAKTEELFYEAIRNPRYSARIDSLSKALANLRQKAIRYRTLYRSTSFFTSYDKRPEDLKAITRLSLADYKGKSLPDTLFLMTNLQELELVNTQIRKLPARLNELKALKKITLLNNRPRGRVRLSKNSTIKTLAISDDEVDRRPRSYRNLLELQVLDLSRNNLNRFPFPKGGKKITRLVLTENQLTLNDLRKSLPKLEDLVLTSNKIVTVPPAIGQFTALKKINLNANQITSLPPEIGKLQKLEQLNLYKNSLTSLPKEIYTLSNLRAIDLYYNQLDQLDTAVRNWSKLEILYLANNRIFTLPDNLGSLTLLRELYLHHNRLSSIPNLSGLDSLRVLRVNNNMLLEFPAPVVTLRMLENLDLASNQIASFPKDLFDLPKLKILSLKGNPIEGTLRPYVTNWARSTLASRPVVIHLEGISGEGGTDAKEP